MSEKKILSDSSSSSEKTNGERRNHSIFVDIGTSVKFQEVQKPETIRTIHIVGNPDELNPLKGKFMHHAPVPQALLGGRKGDIIRVKLPNEVIHKYEILDVFLKGKAEHSYFPQKKKPLCLNA